MYRHKHQLFYLFVIVTTLISLSGCIVTGGGSRLPDQVLNSSDDLPVDLAAIQIFFSKNQNSQTFGHITTLDEQDQTDFTLENEGRDLNVSPDKTRVVYKFTDIVGVELRSSLWWLDLKDCLVHRVILWPEKYTDISLGDPNFYPAGDRLIFSVTWYDTDTTGLGLIDLDGNNLEIINTPQRTFSKGPKISPDGEKILVLCEGIDRDSGKPGFMLCIMDKDGSHRRLLMNDGSYHGTFLFTPDSQSIIYSEAEWGGLIGLINKPRYQINSIGVDGKNQETILIWHRAINVLALDKDGGEIIFMDRPESDKATKIYIIDKDGTNLRHLAYFDDFLGDW